ncbi:MAG: ribbon-helix-helix protein, CopG family [Myxococcales bacterium]|nr:ribbon-helix-helix protein, CopG family [Myxococcales bacterium]
MREIDEEALAKLEQQAEVAGGGQVPPPPVPPGPTAVTTAPTPPEPAVPPRRVEPKDLPSAFAELLEAPRAVASGRGTVADPRVRMVDGRAVRASTVHLPLELYDQVDQIAKATGRSRSAIIEWSLQKLLAS